VEACGDTIDNNCDGALAGECFLSGEVSLDAAVAWRWGETSGDWAGSALSGGGDFNGDGFDDVVVGAHGADNGSGSHQGIAYVMNGPLTGAESLAGANARFIGDANDSAGATVSHAGDHNGDGLDDLLVGAPWRYEDATSNGEGAIYLALGPVTGDLHPADADGRITGPVFEAGGYSYGGAAGESLDGLGDGNGDGHPDILIGAPDVPTSYSGHSFNIGGAVYLLHGPATGTIDLDSGHDLSINDSAGSALGHHVRFSGDTDGDGMDELLVGVPGDDTNGSNSGGLYILEGDALGSTDLADAATAIYGSTDDLLLSLGVSAGDTNADGYGDLLLGTDEADKGSTKSTGIAAVFLGPVSGPQQLTDANATLVGADSGDEVGFSVAGPGDINGDGRDDVLIGAPGVENDKGERVGSIYLFYGAPSGTLTLKTADAQIHGTTEKRLGINVSGAGDTNGDGMADLLASYYGGTEAGDIWLFVGGTD